MPTYQPPGDSAVPGDGLPQPQDPWAGSFEAALAAAPTDPFPHVYQSTDQGTTSAHPGPASAPEVVIQPSSSRRTRATWALAFSGVALIAIGVGAATWYVAEQQKKTGSSAAAATTTASSLGLDPHVYHVGDCFIPSTIGKQTATRQAACTELGAHQILRIAAGSDLRRDDAGHIDAIATGSVVCVNLTYTHNFTYDHPSDRARDLFFCTVRHEEPTPGVTGS